MPWPLDLHKSGFKVDVAMLFWRTEAQRSRGTSPKVPSLSGGAAGLSPRGLTSAPLSTPLHQTASCCTLGAGDQVTGTAAFFWSLSSK